MNTKSTSVELLNITTLLLPFIYVGLIWKQLPAEIAIHYTLSGNPNGWVPKETSVLIVGVIATILYVTLLNLPKIDPKGRLQSPNFEKLRFVIYLCFAAMMICLWYMADHQVASKNMLQAVLFVASLLLAGMGNYMTTIKPNWLVGIRTPWTLGNDVVWRRTHRLAGRLMVLGGLVSMVIIVLMPLSYALPIFVSMVLLSTIIPAIYSYSYYRQEKTGQLQ